MMLENITIKKDILADKKYQYLFSVEAVNKLVLEGIPFRDAYKKVGLDIESGQFTTDTSLHHSHEGSIGNLQNDAIARQMRAAVDAFNFGKVESALNRLLL
jgi:argininosuccinate lyase